MHTYEVVASKDIAEEMARYEGAEYEKLEFDHCGIINPIKDEAEAIEFAERFDENGPNFMLYYRFRFTGDYLPSKERWASFGVRVQDSDAL